MSPFIYNPDSTSSTDSVQLFAGIVNINIKFTKILLNTSDFKQLNWNMPSLVDRRSENIERKKFKTLGTASGDSNRCFHQGLGSTLQWGLNAGIWSSEKLVFQLKVMQIFSAKMRFSHLRIGG